MQIVALISLLPFTIAQTCTCDNAGVRSTGQNTYTCSGPDTTSPFQSTLGCPASFPFKCLGSWGDAACFNSRDYALACNGPDGSWCALPYAPWFLMNMNGQWCPEPPVVPDQRSCGLAAACVAAGSFDLMTPQIAICTETCVEVELRVGTSWDNSKTVTASTNLICPATVSAANWLGGYTSSAKFAVQTSGLQVSVQRTDIHEGWTFDLRFQCCQSQRYRVRCRTGSPADCSITVYDLGADPCSAYSPCGLLLVANGSYIDSRYDFNSCPLGWKLFAPRSLQDWTAVRNSFDFPGIRIADVTKPTSGSDGSSAPMNSASRSQWVTADGNSWYLSGTSYTEPSGDYMYDCYLGFDNWNLPNLALGDQLIFNDAGCSYGATTYLCQPDGSTPAVVISCICPNGTPTVASGSGGTLCERTWVDCSSCDSGFALSAPAGLGSQTCQSVNPAFCRQGSPASCSISVYNLGADACSAYSPCGLLQVTNGRYINSKDDVNSCPLGWKLFAPRNLEDWKTVKAKVLDGYTRLVDVTKPTGGSDGLSSKPMNSASRPQWVTSDGADWWLRSTSFSEPNGDYVANCYLELSDIPDFAAGVEFTFNDLSCGFGGRTYLCQPDASAAVSCICPNGTPTRTSGAGGTLCERTWVDCSSCDSGYTLSAPAGLGSQICKRTGPDTTSPFQSTLGPGTTAPAETTAACGDTPNWSNGFQVTCADYAKLNLCRNGAAVPGQEWTLGAAFAYPEWNCCVCGKGGDASCNPGFHKSNMNCVPNVCQCDGGVPVTGVACTSDGANMCSSCNPGFHKSNINCVPNVCQCDGGVPVTGSACSSDGANMCSSCRVGYHITLGSNGMRQTCEKNQCHCSGGIPAQESKCTTTGADLCKSCDAPYILSGPHCYSQCNLTQVGQRVLGLDGGERNAYQVSLSGDGRIMAMVGGNHHSPGGAQGAGAAAVYLYNGSRWVPYGQVLYGEQAFDQMFACALNADGSVLALGSWLNDHAGSDSGQGRVFRLNSDTQLWTQVAQSVYGSSDSDWFGVDIALDATGNTMAIGGSGNAGQAAVYSLQGNQLIPKGQTLTGPGGVTWFGHSVGLSADGDRLIVGAPRAPDLLTDSGCVYMYLYDGTAWVQMEDRKCGGSQKGEGRPEARMPPGHEASGGLGYSVAISKDGNTVAMCAHRGAAPHPGNVFNLGQVRLYRWNGTNWDLNFLLYGNENEEIGWSVALNAEGNIMVIGGGAGFNQENTSGIIRVYSEGSDGEWRHVGSDVKGETATTVTFSDVAISDDGSRVMCGDSMLNGPLEPDTGGRVYDVCGNGQLVVDPGPSPASSGMPSPGASPFPSANSSPALTASPVPSANSSPALGASPVPSANSSPALTASSVPSANSSPALTASPVPSANSWPALGASPVPSAISSPALAASRVPSANSSPALAASPAFSANSSPALGASPLPSVSSSPGLGALAEPLPASKSPAPLLVQQLRPTAKSLMWAFNTLLLLITSSMITLLLVFWRTRTLQVLSPPKVLVFMTGCAVGLCGAYFLAFRNSAVVCPAYLYTRYVGFSLISSPLIVTHRLLLSAIAESARGSYKAAWSLQRSYLELGGLLLVELCILVATATMHGLGYWVWEQDPSGRCPANPPYLLLTAVYMAMLGVCSFYAFRVRKAPGIFNDAKETGLVAYNTLVLSSISVCLQGVQDTSNGWLLAQAMITYASFFGSLCIFFVPRLFMLKEELASLHGRTRVRQMVPAPRLESADTGTPGPSPAQQIVPALSQHESSATSNHRSTQHDGSSAVSEVHVDQRSLNLVQTKQGNQKQESGPPQAETTVRVHNAGQTVAQQMGDALPHPEIQMTEYASHSVLRTEASKNGLSLLHEERTSIHANTIQDSHVELVSMGSDPSDVHDVESSQADHEVNANDIAAQAELQQATMMTTETPETLPQSHSVELEPRTSSFETQPLYFSPLQTVLPPVSLP